MSQFIEHIQSKLFIYNPKVSHFLIYFPHSFSKVTRARSEKPINSYARLNILNQTELNCRIAINPDTLKNTTNWAALIKATRHRNTNNTSKRLLSSLSNLKSSTSLSLFNEQKSYRWYRYAVCIYAYRYSHGVTTHSAPLWNSKVILFLFLSLKKLDFWADTQPIEMGFATEMVILHYLQGFRIGYDLILFFFFYFFRV